MYDSKTVRRRRAVLGLLVACALILLTASFGGSGGAVGSVQRGVSQVLSPVQEGASRALKPVRDLFGWFGDTLNAKGDLKSVRAERDELRREVVRYQGQASENAELRRQLNLNQSLGLDTYRPLGARVISQSPTVWWAQVTINKGTSDGVRDGMPVIDDAGLVGSVTEVTGSTAVVTLISDHTSAVSARTNAQRVPGVVEPTSAGNPTDLLLKFPGSGRIQPGDRIVTRGTIATSQQLPSLFPPGLPIGQVTRIQDPGSDTQEVHVRPFADLRRLEFVQVLTHIPKGDDS
jgi:rod shape-determining protein MreC